MNFFIRDGEFVLPDRTEAVQGNNRHILRSMAMSATQHPDSQSNSIMCEVASGSFRNAYYLVAAATLLQKAHLDALLNQLTASPVFLNCSNAVVTEEQARAISGPEKSEISHSIDELRDLSKLTNEEIAPLIGVSRRSLQLWLAGGTISAPKQRRLQEILSALREMSASGTQLNRQKLIDRQPGTVSPYNLLMEGKFDDAVSLVLGRRSTSVPPSISSFDLLSQINQVEGEVMPQGRLNRRLSGRLHRR
jgi:hypothetical protein